MPITKAYFKSLNINRIFNNGGFSKGNEWRFFVEISEILLQFFIQSGISSQINTDMNMENPFTIPKDTHKKNKNVGNNWTT